MQKNFDKIQLSCMLKNSQQIDCLNGCRAIKKGRREEISKKFWQFYAGKKYNNLHKKA